MLKLTIALKPQGEFEDFKNAFLALYEHITNQNFDGMDSAMFMSSTWIEDSKKPGILGIITYSDIIKKAYLEGLISIDGELIKEEVEEIDEEIKKFYM